MTMNRFRPVVEGLEKREALAGNVMITVTPAAVYVDGDNKSNSVTATLLPDGSIRFNGSVLDGAATKIQGQPSVKVPLKDQSLFINLGPGDDALDLRGSPQAHIKVFSDLGIAMGSGVDLLNVSYVKVGGKTDVDMGDEPLRNGSESAFIRNFESGNVRIHGGHGLGFNTFAITDAVLRENIWFSDVDGASTIVGLTRVSVVGWVIAELGNDFNGPGNRDSFSATDCSIGARLYVHMGQGRAIVSITRVVADSMDIRDGDYDADQIIINSCRVRNLWIDGGLGIADSLSGAGNVITENLVVVHIESNSLGWSRGA